MQPTEIRPNPNADDAGPPRPQARRLLSVWAAPALVFVLAFGLRWHGIADKPFWLDEITTLFRSRLPFTGIVSDSLSFHHLPAYFLLTSWMERFGDTELMSVSLNAAPYASVVRDFLRMGVPA